ncbi:MAG: glycosyltransferase [Clostridia bacterium]|nr:glycosyltransferase [Clostridia bacterium]
MRILEVLDSFYPSVDGPNSVMVSLALTLKKMGHSVDVLVPKYKQIVEVEGLTVHRCKSFPAKLGYRAAFPCFDGKIKKLIKKGNYDVIHLHSPVLLGHFALKQGKKLGIPVVFTFHTKFKDEIKNRSKSRLIQNISMNYIMGCINRSDCVTTVSRGSIATLEEYGYKKCGEVTVIHNGTDMPPMASDPSDIAKIRKELSLEGNFGFLFAGRLAEVKNIQFSLKALAKVKERGVNNFRFVIVGDGDYGKNLRQQVDALNLNDNVIFVGKITDRKILANYFAACYAMLFPSLFDTASITIPEAAANGLPSIMIKGSSSSEVIEGGVSGFLWENDADVWADEMIKLINDPSIAEKVGQGALEKVYSSWDDIAREYVKLYKRLIADAEDKKRR